MFSRLLVGIALVWCCSGCGRDAGLRCVNQERYLGSQEIDPIEIPDDLDEPDASEALDIPGSEEIREGEGPTHGPCTESPPEFFQEGVPG